MPIEIGMTRENASAWLMGATYAAASTRRISSVAYAVEESASDEKTASAVFLVIRSCVKRSVLIGLPTSKRFNEAILVAAARSRPTRAQKDATACSFPKAPTVAKRTYWWPCCFILSNKPTLVFPSRILCHFFRKSMPATAELLLPSGLDLCKKRVPQK